MATTTTRLGLRKPAGSDLVNVLTDISNNADEVDFAVGATWINDGVVPPTGDLFDGKILREITSGKILVSHDNGSGGFTLVPVSQGNGEWARYTFVSNATTSGTAAGAGVTSRTRNTGTLADPADVSISGINLVLTKPGIYRVSMNTIMSTPAGSFRRFIGFDTTGDTQWSDYRASAGPDEDKWALPDCMVVVNAGTPVTVVTNVYQISGGARDFNTSVRISRTDLKL